MGGAAKNGERGQTTMSAARLLISSAMISLEDSFPKIEQFQQPQRNVVMSCKRGGKPPLRITCTMATRLSLTRVQTEKCLQGY